MQDRYDELYEIITTLDILVDNITDKYYIDILNDIKYEAENELEEVEQELIKEQELEERQMNIEFERSKF